MTGGMAFVTDADGLFEEHLNADTVVWQRIATPHWQSVLHRLVAEHRTETGSDFAAHLLAHWEVELGRFWQIVPKEMVARLAQPLSEPRAAAE